jgi:hypothetical protein
VCLHALLHCLQAPKQLQWSKSLAQCCHHPAGALLRLQHTISPQQVHVLLLVLVVGVLVLVLVVLLQRTHTLYCQASCWVCRACQQALRPCIYL